ncbi:MAG: hypothetical protein ACK5ML_00715 [Lachnospiraceae bacterium]
MRVKQRFIGATAVLVMLSAMVFAGCNQIEQVVHDNVEPSEGTEVTSDSMEGSFQLMSKHTKTSIESEETRILTFHSSIQTYELIAQTGEEAFVIDSGTFSQEGSQIHTYSETSDEYTLGYIMEGDYLLLDDSYFDGEIPGSDSFDLTVTLDTEALKDQIVFFENGSYLRERQNNEEISIQTEGTYQRIDSILTLYDDEGNAEESFYIYEDQLVSEYYKKAADQAA